MWEGEKPKHHCFKFVVIWLINFEFLPEFKSRNCNFRVGGMIELGYIEIIKLLGA